MTTSNSPAARHCGSAQNSTTSVDANHLGECREVGREEIRRAAAGLDVGDDASTSVRVTAMHQHPRDGLPELVCNEPANTVCRTGDQCGLSAQLFHPRSPHVARRARLLWDVRSSKSSLSERTIARCRWRQNTKG